MIMGVCSIYTCRLSNIVPAARMMVYPPDIGVALKPR
jgi:hypothetical protein